MDAGFTFITIGWTSTSSSVIMEVHENRNLSEQPNKEVEALYKKNLIAKPECTTREN